MVTIDSETLRTPARSRPFYQQVAQLSLLFLGGLCLFYLGRGLFSLRCGFALLAPRRFLLLLGLRRRLLLLRLFGLGLLTPLFQELLVRRRILRNLI